MGPEINETREETRGRPTKGYFKLTKERKIRLDPYVDQMLIEKCRRLGCSVADGIRAGIMLFLNDRRY